MIEKSIQLDSLEFCSLKFGGPEKGRLYLKDERDLLAAGILGHGLCAFRHGVFGQLAGQKETNGRLDFPGRDGRAFVVFCQTGRLSGDALENVVDEAVHDRHGFRGDSRVGMNLLQNFVDVSGVALRPLLAPRLLIALHDTLLGLSGLLRSFSADFGGHFSVLETELKCLNEKRHDYLYHNRPSCPIRW